jgi:hypothetical protein
MFYEAEVSVRETVRDVMIERRRGEMKTGMKYCKDRNKRANNLDR